MTDTEQSAVATLRDLLPEIESREGALHPYNKGELFKALGIAPGTITWNADTDLQAADDLVRECGYYRDSGDERKGYGVIKEASVWSLDNTIITEGTHPTDEPRAILAALVRAMIAELEGKDA